MSDMTAEELVALSDEELSELTLNKLHDVQMKALSEAARMQHSQRRKACILFLQQGERASRTTFDEAEEAARKLWGAQ